nr:MAG TPA: hypothetical protein [Ackermannviridae sp.]
MNKIKIKANNYSKIRKIKADIESAFSVIGKIVYAPKIRSSSNSII